jgi:hypothetical protein
MRLRLLAAAVFLTSPTGSLFAADPELLSLAPPDTQVIAGGNVAQANLTPFGQYLLAQGQQQSNAGLEKLLEATGFDPRRDLREFVMAVNGGPGANSAIVLARGTFNVSRIVEAAVADGQTVETYKGVPIVQWNVQQKGAIAFPDATLTIAGDPASVRAAIDRRSAPTAISSALAVAVNQASTTEDAWFVSMAPPPQMDMVAADTFAPLRKILQASGGVKFGASVVVTLKAVSQTPQDASALAEMLKSLAGMAQMGAPSTGPAANAVALLQNLKVSADGTTTSVSLSIPEQQVEELMKAGAAGK